MWYVQNVVTEPKSTNLHQFSYLQTKPGRIISDKLFKKQLGNVFLIKKINSRGEELPVSFTIVYAVITLSRKDFLIKVGTFHYTVTVKA